MHIKALPLPSELTLQFPIDRSSFDFVLGARQTIKNILDGIDKRLLFVVGPCSIHDLESTLEYAKKFRILANEVKDKFYLVMRTYLEKPRTTIGWKGFIFDPYLNDTCDIASGLTLARQLLINLTEMQIPLGCELLELTTTHYIGDLLSWGCIGARTTTSQPHRLLASGLNLPIGFKNTTDGNIDNSVNAIVTANSSHTFLGLDKNGSLCKITTEGNSYCHVVLRGQENQSNYDSNSLNFALKKIEKANILNRILVDCSHGNCGKIYSKQVTAFNSIIDQIQNGNSNIAGAMLESHLYAGSQSIPKDPLHLKYGVSVTDPCLDWNTTEELIKRAYCRFETTKLNSHLLQTIST